MPNNVKLTRVDTGQLTFTWTSVNFRCPSINYMATLDCGTCTVAVGDTTATCSGLLLPNVCTFTVQTVVCEQVGAPSDPVTVILRGMYMHCVIFVYVEGMAPYYIDTDLITLIFMWIC